MCASHICMYTLAGIRRFNGNIRARTACASSSDRGTLRKGRLGKVRAPCELNDLLCDGWSACFIQYWTDNYVWVMEWGGRTRWCENAMNEGGTYCLTWVLTKAIKKQLNWSNWVTTISYRTRAINEKINRRQWSDIFFVGSKWIIVCCLARTTTAFTNS